MSIKTEILDGSGTDRKAAIVSPDDNLKAGLITYTHPATVKVQGGGFFFNSTYGFDMAQNGEFSGTPEVIHNGTDSSAWTGSNLSGSNFVFDSTDQAQSGTKSVDGTGTNNNNEALFTAPSSISTSDHTALSGWIYITLWPTTGTQKELEFRNRLSGVNVGDTVNLSDFVDIGVLNTWQKFSIPISEFNMGTTTIDELVVKSIDIGSGASPEFYLDNIQWEEAGSPIIFELAAPENTLFEMKEATFAFAATANSTLTNASHDNVTYNKLANQSLTTGLIARQNSSDGVVLAGIFTNHITLMSFPNTTFQSGGDGTSTWYVYRVFFTDPVVLDGRKKAKLEVIVSDDLSSLLYFRTSARGAIRLLSEEK